jgi:hypothetical protein
MSTNDKPTRLKPSQVRPLRVLEESDAGTVEELAPSTYLEDRHAEYAAQIFSGRDILTGIEPKEFLVPRWFVKDGTSLVIAKPGGGKSFFAVMVGMAFATGGTFAGHTLPRKKVLYIAAERASSVRDRFQAYTLFHDADDEGFFSIWEMTRPLDATKPDAALFVAEQVKRLGAEIVVLDTYAQLTAEGKENDANETSKVIRDFLAPIVKATSGGHVILVHHQGKNVENGARGSTALVGAADAEITLSFEKATGNRTATVSKLNDGEDGATAHFRIESVEVPEQVTKNGRRVPSREVGVMVSSSAPLGVGEDVIRECVAACEREGGASRVDIQVALGHSTDEERKQKKNSTSQRIGLLIKQGKLAVVGNGKSTRYVLGPVWKLLEAESPGEE